ncbi:MAG: hypothetical protein PHH54_01510 [Candidatus Nanoarchaeia archaeon]|nr:hypothetical protein [Candidatus Nanoarchaeia archaeon]MDD5740641.1 hypothetical protein [Candidatus Nanoarchaeia archaeon]
MKKGQSGLITVILILLLILLAIIIVWNVVKLVVEEKAEGISVEQLRIGLKIESVYITEDNETIYVSINRKAGKGDISALKFIFTDSAGNNYIYKYPLAEGIPDELETKVYKITTFAIQNQNLDFDNFANIISVGIAFEIETSSGKTITSIIKDEFKKDMRKDVSLLNEIYAPIYEGKGDEELIETPAEKTFDGWRAVIVKSQEDYEQNRLPGEGMQCAHSMVRSYSNPEYIYWALDCGQGWRSRNGGETWERFLSKGLGTFFGQSIEVDPANPKTVFITVDNNWRTDEIYYEGLYKSTDMGDNWEFVLSVYYNESNTLYKHNIAYALSSVSNGKAMIWYAAFANVSLYKSINGGNNWSLSTNLTNHAPIYALYVHPEHSDILYLGSKLGLYRSTNGGLTLSPLGNLPSGEVTSIQINNQNPNEIYAVVKDNGLYKSTDGGASFSLLRAHNYSRGCFINQGYPEIIYFTTGQNLYVSEDGGITWNNLAYHPREGLGRETGFGSKMDWGSSAIIPNSNNKCEAVGYGQCYLWKTTNCTDFYHANNLFSGYAWTCRDGIFFDYNNSERVGSFGADMGLFISKNGGIYYEILKTPYNILASSYGFAGNSNDLKAGAFQPGTSTIVASGGNIWGRGALGIIWSPDNDGPWETTTLGGQLWNVSKSLLGSYRNYFYNPDNPNELFVSDIKSNDGGKTFYNVSFLADNDLEIYGMCKSNPNILYALNNAGTSIYRSDNRGENWYLYVAPGITMGNEIVFEVDPVDCNKIYTFHSATDLASFNGSSWKLFNLTSYMRSLPENEGLVSLYPTDWNWQKAYPNIGSVIVDPNNNSIIYATVTHAGVEPVYRSMDGGDTWEDISYNLPRAGYGPVFSINPHSGEIFVSSCSGTWVFPPPYNQTTTMYLNSVSRPSCDDSLQNGDETGIDSGGSCVEIGPTAKCSETNTSCGIWPNCNNCNLQDICNMNNDFVDYYCSEGSCAVSTPKNCDDFNICTTDSCSSTGCSNIMIDLDTSQTCCIASYFWKGGGGDLNCCGDDANEANPYQAIETSCADGSDNDCNGDIDCDDVNCINNPSCIPPDVPAGYVSYWRFEGDTEDENGINNGAIIGNSQFVSGQYGQALNLYSNGDYVLLDTSQTLNLTNHTRLLWLKTTTGASNLNIFFSNIDGDYCSVTPTAGDFRVAWRNATGGSKFLYHYHGLDNTTVWNHVAITYVVNGNEVNVSYYKNGVYKLSLTNNEGFSPSPLGAIGARYSGANGFNGSIDEVVIYNRTLNQSEIRQVYCNQGGDVDVCADWGFFSISPFTKLWDLLKNILGEESTDKNHKKNFAVFVVAVVIIALIIIIFKLNKTKKKKIRTIRKFKKRDFKINNKRIGRSLINKKYQ